ncbi:MAG: ABC transporter substrate-binding protein [Granulosicoccus sp.]
MENQIKHKKAFDQSRRLVLKSGAVSVATSAMPLLSACSSTDTEAGSNEGTSNPGALKIGLTIPLSGAYADEGRDQQRGFELAIKHLNGEGDAGMLSTMQPSSLQGNGVFGRPVEFVIADTETRSSVAISVATQLINEDKVSMLIGGSTSGTAIAIQGTAQELGAVYMTGMAHANEVTSSGGQANAFRQYMNSTISSSALAQTMVSELGASRSAYYLTADYIWGDVTGAAIQQATEQLGWQTVASVPTPVGAVNFTTYLDGFLDSGADVLVLVHYGNDMINSVTQARSLGIPQMQVNGNAVAMAIPVFTTLMAEGAGGANIEGVYGTMNWHWSLQDDASVAFTSSYETEYGVKPSEAAHTVYVQTLQYADAVERAGSFLACDVVHQLEGHSFDGTGNGACFYRTEDHQCFKDTLVVAGRAAPATASDLLEIRNTVARADVSYAVDSAFIFGGAGFCSNG